MPGSLETTAISADVTDLSASRLAELIRRKELQPSELMMATIAKIEKRNPRLNAIVIPMFDDAVRAAKRADEIALTDTTLPPLFGVPVAMKDCFDFKPGWVSTYGGIRALSGNVADSYCAFADRMERAGAIIVGKTNSPTLGFRGTCDNYLFGPTRNPFDLNLNSGGSSGGSAAAVADGLLPIAEGTDGGGSIRIPAAWCGVYGYKPSFGRVPNVVRPNAFGAIAPFDFEGPITRTVEDAALALQAMFAHDPRDPFSLDEAVDLGAALQSPISGWRIAFTSDFGIFPVDTRIENAVRSALPIFEDLGAHIEEVSFGIERSNSDLSDLWCRMISHGNIDLFDTLKRDKRIDLERDHPDDLPPSVLEWMQIARSETFTEWRKGQEIRSEIVDAFEDIFDDHRLIVSPTMACPPVPNSDDGDTLGPSSINGVSVNRLIGYCMTYLVNFTGHPAANIPCGMTSEGHPVGLQIIGRRHADADVIAASARLEEAINWQAMYQAIDRSQPL